MLLQDKPGHPIPFEEQCECRNLMSDNYNHQVVTGSYRSMYSSHVNITTCNIHLNNMHISGSCMYLWCKI
jgi:hypothetical protein